MQSTAITTRAWVGLSIAMVAAASFGSSGAFAKGLIAGGWSPGAVVTLRVAGAALLLAPPVALAMRGRWRDVLAEWRLLTAYGLMGVAGCQLAYFMAVSHIDVGVALLLEYLAPVLLVGWVWLRHGHRPRRLTLLGVVLALGGLALVLDIGGGAHVDLVGVAWGLVAAIGLCGYFLLSADSDRAVPPLVLAGAGLVVGTVVLAAAGAVGILPMQIGATEVALAGTVVPWWAAIAELAVVSAALAYVAGVASVRVLGTKVASFVGLTEVLFASLFAWVLLGEVLGPVQILGAVLVLGGVIAVRADERTGERAPEATGVPAAARRHADAEGDLTVDAAAHDFPRMATVD